MWLKKSRHYTLFWAVPFKSDPSASISAFLVFATAYVSGTHTIWPRTTLGPVATTGARLVEIHLWNNKEGQKVAENVRDSLVCFFFWSFRTSMRQPYYLLTCALSGCTKNIVQGYWLQWWWTGLAGNPDRSRVFLDFEWLWRDFSLEGPGLHQCRTPTSR